MANAVRSGNGLVEITYATVAITTPADGATYTAGQVVNAAYSCENAPGTVASCVGTVANGAPIDTATLGVKTFTVTATGAEGNVTSQTVSYTVAAPASGGGGGGGGSTSSGGSTTGGEGGGGSVFDPFPGTDGFAFGPPAFESASAGSSRAAARQRGTTIRFQTDEAGTASVLVEKLSPGIRIRGECLRRTRARVRANPNARRCTYVTSIGTLTYQVAAGQTSFAWRGSDPITGRALPPGLYRATMTVTDSAGQRSAPRTATFRILRPRR
jgi:hypothetical protein